MPKKRKPTKSSPKRAKRSTAKTTSLSGAGAARDAKPRVARKRPTGANARKSSEPASRLRTKQIFTRELLEELLFGSGRVRRFTQDSPVLPDVWLDYAGVAGDVDEWTAPDVKPSERKRLLITPYKDKGAGAVRREIVKRLPSTAEADARVAYNQTTVAASLRFDELVSVLLPMTDWWARIEKELPIDALHYGQFSDLLATAIADPEHAPIVKYPAPQLANADAATPANDVDGLLIYRFPPALLWTVRVIGALQLVREGGQLPKGFRGLRGVAGASASDWKQVVKAFLKLIEGVKVSPEDARIYSVSRNRVATPAVTKSTLAIKADAARRVFNISCAGMAWAIIDSGIDATHPAFRMRSGPDATPDADPFKTRVLRTYDFTQIDKLLDPKRHEEATMVQRLRKEGGGSDLDARINDLRTALESGRPLDWQLLEPMLRVPHEPNRYLPPPADHGTHVAGILAGNWKASESNHAFEEDLTGTCPDLALFDLRVFDQEGRGDEFGIMAALQFVRWLNSSNDYMVVYGANLSLSIRHEIANYACGRTPVCDECERLVSSGVVVVAAAGNQGHRRYTTERGLSAEAYNSISITDPGNAEEVLTVGATHRYRPHTYGVSYFSSRGPTGDGRRKPDIVAPGEKIVSTLPNAGFGSKDGTSMAAPHVSGAAALLLARHNELVGQPKRVKAILVSTATDLGRERYFQGAGMLDVLRALQSL